MKIEIENLKAQMAGWDLNIHQKAQALIEFNKLVDYVDELEQLLIQRVDNLLFCGKCGNKLELIIETDINSGRTCKSRLCTGK